MEIHLTFGYINWLSVLIAALAAFITGSVWYSPVLFGKIWQKEVNFKEEQRSRMNMPVLFVTVFVLQFVAAFFLKMFIGTSATMERGLVIGLIVSLAWISTALAINSLFTFKSFTLFLIDSGYYLVMFLIMGLILGIW
jgi:hypothetical protein